MMKRYLIIPGLLLAFILFSAKSCEEDAEETRRQEEAELMEEISRVKNEFRADYLNDESLFVFEQKAIQKLKDFADYMNVAHNTSLDSAFRAQADTMVQELFYGQQAPVISSYPAFNLFIDSIQVIEPLHRTGNSGYQGILGYREKVMEYAEGDTVISSPTSKRIEMIATKSTSAFGSDTLRIWKVYLGELVTGD